MLSLEFDGVLFGLTDGEGGLLAANLRNYANGLCEDEVKRAAELSGNPNWTDGALCAADFMEEALVGNLDGPLPLEGKAAEATYWTLRLMQGVEGSVEADGGPVGDVGGPEAVGGGADGTGIAALRDALATRFASEPRREAA
jgi:hypothetical protein